VVHCRDAEADVVRILQESAAEHGSLSGVMHSFCGSAENAAVCLEAGMHISFAGMLTYKKNETLRETARVIPLNRLLVETDSPYLAPQPNRGKRNEPAWVRWTAECLAAVHGLSLSQLAEQTTANARKLFKV
jgi:TatD DNase family protein